MHITLSTATNVVQYSANDEGEDTKPIILVMNSKLTMNTIGKEYQ